MLCLECSQLLKNTIVRDADADIYAALAERLHRLELRMDRCDNQYWRDLSRYSRV